MDNLEKIKSIGSIKKLFNKKYVTSSEVADILFYCENYGFVVYGKTNETKKEIKNEIKNQIVNEFTSISILFKYTVNGKYPEEQTILIKNKDVFEIQSCIHEVFLF
jgi:hypothetical protein